MNVFVPWILSEFESANPSFSHVICVTGGFAAPVTIMVMVFPTSPSRLSGKLMTCPGAAIVI